MDWDGTITVRILMCGSRTWRNQVTIWRECERLLLRYGDTLVIIHGDEPNGADELIRLTCEELRIYHEMYCAAKPRYTAHKRFAIEQVADWDIHGKSAGMIRNSFMLSTGIDGVVGFRSLGKSNGTDHMCKIARQADKPVIVYQENGVCYAV